MSEKKVSVLDWVSSVLYAAGFFMVAIFNIAGLMVKVITDPTHTPLWLILGIICTSFIFIAVGLGMTISMARHGIR